MARRVFFSFHFANDFWRTQQIKNMGALDGQQLCNPNVWEELKRKGDDAIEGWIEESMVGKSCVVVLVGAETASRKWVRHEISTGWNAGKAVLGIRINKLLNVDGKSAVAGADPFATVKFKNSTRTLVGLAPLMTPAGSDSKAVYKSIADNMEAWIEVAIEMRKKPVIL